MNSFILHFFSVFTTTTVWAGRSGNRGSIVGREKTFFSSPSRAALGAKRSPTQCHEIFFLRTKWLRCAAGHYLYLASRLRMRWAAPMWYLMQHRGQINSRFVLYYITYDSTSRRIRKEYFQITFLESDSKLKDECSDFTEVSTTYTVTLQLCSSIFVYIAHLFDCIFQIIIFKTSFIKDG